MQLQFEEEEEPAPQWSSQASTQNTELIRKLLETRTLRALTPQEQRQAQEAATKLRSLIKASLKSHQLVLGEDVKPENIETEQAVHLEEIEDKYNKVDQETKPPINARFLLTCILPRESREAVLGDLEEDYQDVAEEFGEKRANIFYWCQVAKSLGPLVSDRLKSIWDAVVGAVIERMIGGG